MKSKNKSLGDGMTTDDLYKMVAYAYLYKGIAEYVNSRAMAETLRKSYWWGGI